MLKPANKFMYQLLALFLLAGTFVACKDDDVAPAPDENVAINEWIYDVMKEVYLWTDEIPSNIPKNQDPTDYFDKLLSPKDRFSWIVPDYQDLINSLSGISKEAGYEYMLSRASANNDDVVAIVLYSKKDSPAFTAGIKRGDVITHINGTKMTMTNYRTAIGQISETHTVDYLRYNEATEGFEPQQPVSLATVELAENPNYMHQVFELDGGKKVGYYVYNFFAAGPTTDTQYDQEMENIIADFKSKGVNELILDLRYNSGGSVSSARKLGSLLGRGVSSSKEFYKYRWNSLIQAYWESRSDGQANLIGYFLDNPSNIGNDLSSPTLYVLTGSRSASASELIINGLAPYMDVVLIGEKTVGKNVGSIPFEDKKNDENPYGILPIVFEIANSLGDSNYGNGFAPNYAADDFTFPMRELGDRNEPLLATALSVIGGEGGRIAPDKTPREVLTPIMTSIDRKARTNRLIFDGELPRLAPQQ
jgi:carboxyl-terminal processing protease